MRRISVGLAVLGGLVLALWLGSGVVGNALAGNDPSPNADASWFDTNTPGRTKSLGHPNEIGSLWATLAGMLNAICVIDALIHAPRNRNAAAGAVA